MAYLFAGLKSVVGGQGDSDNSEPSGTETIDRLCDRVASATLLDDRRDAVRALKSLSKKFRLEVGTRAMDLLVNVLQQDRSDQEIVGLALEALCNVVATDPNADVELKAGQSITDAELGVQFTEIFLKKAENITSLLELLEEYDFRVRWPAVKLLTSLLTNRAIQIQQAVLVSPLGVSRLMDLLSDSREVIRNDGLILLIHLCKGNAAIQSYLRLFGIASDDNNLCTVNKKKIVAFENAFDRLLEVVSEEGFSDGGIIVEDCLELMHNLLKSNVSNQNFFREGRFLLYLNNTFCKFFKFAESFLVSSGFILSYIQRLTPYFEFGEATDDSGWPQQKVKNVLLMLQLLRMLVSPSNPTQATLSSQKVMNQCGLLKVMCNILMSSGIPADVLTETINTVAEIIRGCQANQDYFAAVNAPATPPRPAIVVLLMSMVNDKQPFPLRCAVLYCFQCYLYKNQTGQAQIIATLLPSTAEANVITAGQLLCAGLFSPDSFANWCAATALAHALKGSKELKEQLLRVQLASGVGNTPVSLLQQCTNILSQGGTSVQTRAGIMSLLCSWLHACPLAVTHFLHNSSNIPFLTAQVEENSEANEVIVQGLSALLIGVCIVYNNTNESKEEIKRIVATRIDFEHFLAKISNVSKTEYFTNAAKQTQIQLAGPEEVLFDHEFTKLFKKLDASVSKTLQADQDDEADGSQDQSKSREEHDSIVASYKELIREQDDELNRLKARCKEMEKNYYEAHCALERQAVELTQLRAQIELSKGVSEETGESETQSSLLQLNPLKTELAEKTERIQTLENEIFHLRTLLEEAKAEGNVEGFMALEAGEQVKVAQHQSNKTMIELDSLRGAVSQLQAEKEQLQSQLQNKENEVTELQSSLQRARANSNVEEFMAMEASEQVKIAQQQSNKTMVELDSLRNTVNVLQDENLQLRSQLEGRGESADNSNNRVKDLEEKLKSKIEECDQQKSDYEDLLVLLEDQDEKIKKFKNRLKELGDNLEDDVADDDEDDDDGDDRPEDDIKENALPTDNLRGDIELSIDQSTDEEE